MEALEYILQKFRSVVAGNSDRLMHFYIAARHKRDVKTCWDDLVTHLKAKNKSRIESALRNLELRGVGSALK